jgi:hypothetical protein
MVDACRSCISCLRAFALRPLTTVASMTLLSVLSCSEPTAVATSPESLLPGAWTTNITHPLELLHENAGLKVEGNPQT